MSIEFGPPPKLHSSTPKPPALRFTCQTHEHRNPTRKFECVDGMKKHSIVETVSRNDTLLSLLSKYNEQVADGHKCGDITRVELSENDKFAKKFAEADEREKADGKDLTCHMDLVVDESERRGIPIKLLNDVKIKSHAVTLGGQGGVKTQTLASPNQFKYARGNSAVVEPAVEAPRRSIKTPPKPPYLPVLNDKNGFEDEDARSAPALRSVEPPVFALEQIGDTGNLPPVVSQTKKFEQFKPRLRNEVEPFDPIEEYVPRLPVDNDDYDDLDDFDELDDFEKLDFTTRSDLPPSPQATLQTR